MQKILKLALNTDSILDREVIRILQEIKQPSERKRFILSALLYYNRSPSFLAQEEFRLLFDQYLDRFDSLLKNKREFSTVDTPLVIEQSEPELNEVELPEVCSKNPIVNQLISSFEV